LTTQEHLVYPSVIALLKITTLFAKRIRGTGFEVQSHEELKERLRRIVREYCRNAWNDERLPLYLFDSNWNSPQLEHDLDSILKEQLITLSELKISEMTMKFLENYEKMGIFSDYLIENIEKIMDKILEEMMKEANLNSSKTPH